VRTHGNCTAVSNDWHFTDGVNFKARDTRSKKERAQQTKELLRKERAAIDRGMIPLRPGIVILAPVMFDTALPNDLSECEATYVDGHEGDRRMIATASLAYITRRLVASGKAVVPADREDFLDVILLCRRYTIPAIDFCEALISLYGFDCRNSTDMNDEQSKAWTTTYGPVTQQRVLHVFQQWLKHYWTDSDAPAAAPLRTFLTTVARLNNTLRRPLLDLLDRCLDLGKSPPSAIPGRGFHHSAPIVRPTIDGILRTAVVSPPNINKALPAIPPRSPPARGKSDFDGRKKPPRAPSLAIEHLAPDRRVELARQLTLIHAARFRRMEPRALLEHHVEHGDACDTDCAAKAFMREMDGFRKCIRMWVVESILMHEYDANFRGNIAWMVAFAKV
jgi:hypothetical protein